MAVTKLPNRKKEDVADIIDTALEEDYDEIIVIGFKGSRYFVHHSELADAMRILGSLEMAKHEILRLGEEDYE